MFKTKTLMAASMLVYVLTASAESASTPANSTPKGQPDPARFSEHKQKVLARIQTHLQVLQTLQSCVQAANDQPAIRACEKTAHEKMPHHEGMRQANPQ